MSKYIFTMALIHMVAWAQNDNDIIPSDYMMDEDETDAVEDLIDEKTGKEYTTLPRGSPQYPRHYFKGTHYQYELDADEKLAQLWEMLVPDENV